MNNDIKERMDKFGLSCAKLSQVGLIWLKLNYLCNYDYNTEQF